MSKVKIVAENALFLLIGKVIAKFIGVFTLIIIARYLGDVGYGKYTTVFTYISFLSIVSELGIAQILVREISRKPETAGKLIGNAILVKSALSLLAFFGVTFTINLLKYSIETVEVVQIAALILLVDVFNIYGVIYEVNLKMKYSAFLFILNRLLMLVFITPVTYLDLGINYIILATVATNGIQNICAYRLSRKFLKVEFEIDTHVCKYLVKESLPLALSSIFTLIFYRIDILMLSLMKGDAAVGIYSAAYRLSEVSLFLPEIFMTSMFPLMSKWYENSNNILAFSYKKAIKYLFSVALPMAVGTTILSERITLVVYGDTFRNSIITLQILIWATAIIFINSATGSFYVSIKKQRFVMIYTGIGVVINVLLNLVLIPNYSYSGAAIATVITELSILIITLYWMPPLISLKRLIIQNYSSVASTIIMSIFLYFTITNFSGLWIIVPSVIIYFISFYLLRGLDIEDKELLRKIFVKNI